MHVPSRALKYSATEQQNKNEWNRQKNTLTACFSSLEKTHAICVHLCKKKNQNQNQNFYNFSDIDNKFYFFRIPLQKPIKNITMSRKARHIVPTQNNATAKYCIHHIFCRGASLILRISQVGYYSRI